MVEEESDFNTNIDGWCHQQKGSLFDWCRQERLESFLFDPSRTYMIVVVSCQVCIDGVGDLRKWDPM